MRNLKNLIPYLARYKAFLLTGLVVLLLLSSVTLVQPYLLRLGIDGLQANNFEPLICLVIVLVGLVQFGLGFMQRWSVNRVGHLIEADLRKSLFKKLQKLDRGFYDQNSIGDLIVHSTSDISIQRNFIVQGIVSGCNTLFMGTIALILMFSQNWNLALAGLVFLPFLAVAFSYIRRHMETVYQNAQERLGEVSNRVQEVLSGIRVVKAYTDEEVESQRYAEENRLYVVDRLKFARLNSLLIPLIQLATGLTTGLLLWIGANEIQAGNLTIGQFVQFNAYLLLLAGPLSNLGTVLGIGQQAAISMGRLQRILQYKPVIAEPDPEEAVEVPAAQPGQTTLEFKDAGQRFGEKWALRHLNFKVQTGQTVAVVGPTGSGKSSLASLIGRIYDPDEGAVLLNGVNVKQIPLAELRRRISYVPQETLLFSLSLRENIAFGKNEAGDEEILLAAELSRLSQDLPQIPGGYDAKVGERGVTLSGGQKQRTAIARALLPDSELLILDDALSSVDASTQNLIAANLKLLAAQGRTTLIVTQRLALVKDADWIVVLEGGQIVAEGTHTSLWEQSDGLYARMYQHELASAVDSLLDEAVFPSATGAAPADGGEAPVEKSKAPASGPAETLAQAAPETSGKGARRRKKVKVNPEDDQDEIVGLNYQGGRLTRLLSYIWRYRSILLLATPVIIAGSLLELAGPLLSKIAIDEYITPRKLDGLGLILVLFVGATVLSFALRYLRSYLMEKIGQLVVRDLRVQLFSYLLRHPLSFFDRYPAGSLIGRLTSDMDAVNDLLSQGAVAVVADLITLAAIIITMFILDWRLALVSLAVLPVLYVATTIFRKILRQAWRSSRRKYSTLVGYMAENYSGMLTIQLFNRQKTNRDRFEELNYDYFQSNRFIVSVNGIFLPLVSFLAQLANALLLLVAGWLYFQSGEITFGLIVAFLQYTERAFTPIRDLAERYTSFQAASASCERIFGLLDQPAAIQDPAKPRKLVETDPATGAAPKDWAEVAFNNVVFGYNPEFPVLKGISFKVRAGEKVAIVGATGAGKTSITSLLGRNYDIQSGSITINGVDIREVTQEDLRKHMALVLQEPVLFKGTIAENIRLGRPELSDEAMREAAEYVGADSFIRQLPGGYNYELQERGTNLSAGQRQLLSFARALAYNPDGILILDEATSSVDSESEATIQEALKKLLTGRTALIIAHRLSTIRDVDRIIVMEKGRIAEMGTQAELLNRGQLYYSLYLNQMSLVNTSA
ncbi:MAG: putative multidrug transporter ATP-binding and permease protein [Chloroflexi bacterium]|nr:putative multidrug transporter ATP-binding and permease protein [Chloroflexota bacterium]